MPSRSKIDSLNETGQSSVENKATWTLYTGRQQSWMKWLLFFFVFAVLAWEGTWTILAAHTDAAREKIYPALSSKYFSQKAGARIFTYLGVFYILAGAVSLLCLGAGIRLPKPTAFMVRPYRLPLGKDYWTVLEIFALCLFLAVQIATIVTRVKLKFHPDWETAKVWYEVTKTLGKTLAITMTVLILPVSKSCFWWELFNIDFPVKYHRWLAWFWTSVVVVHACTAITSLSINGQFKNCMWPSEKCEKPGQWSTYESLITSRIIMWGWLSLLVSLPLIITSIPWFRRHKFEWFYYTHFLFIPAMILMHLHFKNMVYYTSPSLAAYVLDKLLWFCSSRRPIKIVSLTNPAPGFVRLTIALEHGYTYYPGQWVQVKVPAVSLLQWHPMSVSSAPGHSTITIDVKVLGDWTRGLQNLATRFDPNNSVHNCVFLDEFHGPRHTENQGYLNHEAVLMFAGGIGLTPMLAAFRTLVADGHRIPSVRKVVLVWVVKKLSVIDLYREELRRLQSLRKTESGCQLDILVYATLSEKEDEVELVTNETTSRTTPRTKTGDRGPFMQHVFGYGHKLMLTLFAGCGYLLGIFVANVLGYDKEWRAEHLSLLQLCLALVFSGVLVIIAMSGSFLRPTATWPHHGFENESTELSMTESSTDRDNTGTEFGDLDVVIGRRPDLEEITHNVKAWCLASSASSVGVSVCGPDELIQNVIRICRQASSSSIQFVVSEETFEW